MFFCIYNNDKQVLRQCFISNRCDLYTCRWFWCRWLHASNKPPSVSLSASTSQCECLCV